MRNPPVSWYEGLFLRPHHFQAADRHWADTLATSEQWDHPHHYGLVALEFSRDALGNHQFEVRVLKARLRDGTLVSLEFGDEPDRLNLAEAFDRQEEVTIFVAVPKLKLGRPNVGGGDASLPARFVPTRLAIPDEVSGGNEQEVELRNLNVRLLLSTQDLSGY